MYVDIETGVVVFLCVVLFRSIWDAASQRGRDE